MAVPLFVKSADVSPETVSLKVKVYEAERDAVLLAVDHDAVGAVVSEAATVTDTDCVPPPKLV